MDRERDAAPAAPAQLTVMSSGSAARPGPEGPSGIVRVEPETRSERVGKSVLGFRTSGFSRPESRLFGPGIPEVGIGVPGTKPRTSGSGGPETTARAPGLPARPSRELRLVGAAKLGGDGHGRSVLNLLVHHVEEVVDDRLLARAHAVRVGALLAQEVLSYLELILCRAEGSTAF